MSSSPAPPLHHQPLAPEVEPAPHQGALHVVGLDPTPTPPPQPAISVRDAGKCYEVYARPQDRLKQMLLKPLGRRFYREFWALRGVSFDVFPGDAVGILGRNGSGKSTLLQLIAGTLRPSTGSIAVRGRLAAMLELGSGFNMEFTGRENVFLLASILGIPRREMLDRFDDVAAFADIGEFIDQPLKTYSSGMAARLAFAVGFSVQPDIMIVDEILAVGDIGFQQRCVARLRHLRDRGLTLLFVSHSPDSVRSICDKALFLDLGQPRFFGNAEPAVDQYLAFIRLQSNADALASQSDLGSPVPFQRPLHASTRYGTGHVQIERVELLDEDLRPCRGFRLADTITLDATLRAHVPTSDLSVSFLIRDLTGVDLTGTTTFDENIPLPPLAKGDALTVRFQFPCALRPGNFGVSLAVNRVAQRDYSDNVLFDQADSVASFIVHPDPARPVHYKFHQPVRIDWEVRRDQ